MRDWLDNLSDHEKEEWERFVDHTRKHTITAMDESAFVVSIVPKSTDVDIKYAVELGAAIMMEKPIMAVVLPGARIPPKLRLIADLVVETDLDTDEGQQELIAAIKAFRDNQEKE